jgi:CRP-like cAMP-binding protein
VIFHDGDPGDTMHLVTGGHIAIRVTTPLGDVAMLRVLSPGEFFGELAVVSPEPRNATASALDRAETIAIPKLHLDELRARPAVDAVIIEALATEIRHTTAMLMEALYLPSEKRLFRRLVELASAFGCDTEAAVVVPLTQEELAQLAGVTRPTANRLLKHAEADGVLRVTRARVEILDPDGVALRAR